MVASLSHDREEGEHLFQHVISWNESDHMFEVDIELGAHFGSCIKYVQGVSLRLVMWTSCRHCT